MPSSHSVVRSAGQWLSFMPPLSTSTSAAGADTTVIASVRYVVVSPSSPPRVTFTLRICPVFAVPPVSFAFMKNVCVMLSTTPAGTVYVQEPVSPLAVTCLPAEQKLPPAAGVRYCAADVSKLTVTSRLPAAVKSRRSLYSTVSPDATTPSWGESSPGANPFFELTNVCALVPCPVPSAIVVTVADA